MADPELLDTALEFVEKVAAGLYRGCTVCFSVTWWLPGFSTFYGLRWTGGQGWGRALGLGLCFGEARSHLHTPKGAMWQGWYVLFGVDVCGVASGHHPVPVPPSSVCFCWRVYWAGCWSAQVLARAPLLHLPLFACLVFPGGAGHRAKLRGSWYVGFWYNIAPPLEWHSASLLS